MNINKYNKYLLVSYVSINGVEFEKDEILSAVIALYQTPRPIDYVVINSARIRTVFESAGIARLENANSNRMCRSDNYVELCMFLKESE